MSDQTTQASQSENKRKLDVLESLARVLENGFAAASERQRRLIQYLVTEELEGRGERLKAFSIATDVLGRSADFDPQNDSIVRVEMGRIRQALDMYYATKGANDSPRIKFEKGSYRPKIEWSVDSTSAQKPRRLWPAIAVAVVAAVACGALFVILPFGKERIERQATPVSLGSGPRVAVAPIDFSSDVPGRSYLAAGMQGELVGILAEFDWLIVFPIIADKAIDTAPQDLKERVDYIVRLTAQAANGKLAVWALLTEAKTGAVLWSNRYERPMDTLELVELQRNIASRIASDVARPRGAIASLEKTRIANDSFRTAQGFDCYLRALRFQTTFDRGDFREAHACAQLASKNPSNDANALALLALLDLAGEALGYDEPSLERRAEVVSLAERSFRLSDLGSLPRMAGYTAAVCEGDEERFRRISALSLRDYPNNPAVLFDVAARTMLGMHEWSEGAALLERAHKLNPLGDSSYGVLKALDLFRNGQDNQTVLNALNLGSGMLWPPFQVIELALRRRVGDQIGADRLRRSLQAIGFAQGDAYFGLIDRECWSQQVKDMIRQMLVAN